MQVRLTRATLGQRFNGCDPDYIRDVCHGACCRSSTAPGGALVTIHRSEADAIRARGAHVEGGVIVPVAGRCPFQASGSELCGLHGTDAKPFGCIASPFTLAKGGRTVIVRNRYRLLKCYNDGQKLPAWVAFRDSLVLLFGEAETGRIVAAMEAGDQEVTAEMPDDVHARLLDNDATKHAVLDEVGSDVTDGRVDLARVAQEYVADLPLDSVWADPLNPWHGDDAAVGESMDALGFYGAVLVQASTRRLIAGHTRVRQARERGASTVPALLIDVDDETARRILLVDNRSNQRGQFADESLREVLGMLAASDRGLAGTGFADNDLATIIDRLDAPAVRSAHVRQALAERFVVSPFSVLNARDGWWRERKRAWIGLGIVSELGREAIAYNDHAWVAEVNGVAPAPGGGTSIFDPVLCELAYRWFCPPEGAVLDPFAGGSVRGVVAGWLGRSYLGVDLSDAQVAANREQGAAIVPDRPVAWTVGDAADADLGDGCDMVFTCPPYADLERYSDDPRDLSTMDYPAFRDTLAAIMARAVDRLHPDRFAVVVVGDVRGPGAGCYRGLVPDTVRLMEQAGACFYNEAILVTNVGSLPVRIGRQFVSGRKLGKTHQNILVFCKGDPKRAAEACGEVDVTLPPDESEDD